MLVTMKESLNNTLNDILHSDIVTKTKSTIHDLVSGVKNLFRHQSAEPDESSDKINNYLKSPDEIEAELKQLSAYAYNEGPENELTPATGNTTILKVSETRTEIHYFEEALPEYMEENY
jgi:hypothetical protein